MDIDRRSFLELAGFLLAASPFRGCCLVKEPEAICLFSEPESMLAIDTHAHIFNATDLQIKDFLSRVAVRQTGGIGKVAEYCGSLLQTLTWATAPDVEGERLKLAALKPEIMSCYTDEYSEVLTSLRADHYDEAVVELQEATEEQMGALSVESSDLLQPMQALPPSSRGFKQILELPETYPTYEKLFSDESAQGLDLEELTEEGLVLEELTEKMTIRSVLRFIIEMFQYRFVSVYNYLETYSSDSSIKIDLIAPAPVDYDYWLSRGDKAKSSLPDQMALMGEISVLSGGRVHAFVPFDPYRQAVHDLGLDSGFSPIELVQKSIDEYGAIGIKLYPPMGFAPYGNEEVAEEFPEMWKGRSWLTEVAEQDDFPKRLDASLSKLYRYCAEEDVPVMGHSNRSNGPTADFENLASPAHWERAVNSFPGVSFSFGHFGGVGSKDNADQSDAEAFLTLMESDQEAGSRRLRADASYFSKILDNPEQISQALEFIYGYGDSDPKPALERLMYGADWKMLVAEENSGEYLRDFEKVMTELEVNLPNGTGLSKRFFGQNAADFFGLRQGQRNRNRLEQFYDRNKLETEPLWMAKVDTQ